RCDRACAGQPGPLAGHRGARQRDDPRTAYPDQGYRPVERGYVFDVRARPAGRVAGGRLRLPRGAEDRVRAGEVARPGEGEEARRAVAPVSLGRDVVPVAQFGAAPAGVRATVSRQTGSTTAG